MKKLSILLSALLVLTLAGCGTSAEGEIEEGTIIDEINEGLEDLSGEIEEGVEALEDELEEASEKIGEEVEEFEEGLEEGGEALEDTINSLFE